MPSAADYLPRLKDRLLLDADDPIFSGPLFVGEGGEARKKLRDLVSTRSEDAITWSVFHSFTRLPTPEWMGSLLATCPSAPRSFPESIEAVVECWRKILPPRSALLWMLEHLDQLSSRAPEETVRRLERVRHDLAHWLDLVCTAPPPRGLGVFEGPTEADLVVETPQFTVLIESKYTSDIATATTSWPQRDQIARCIDAALELAGPDREPYFVLITDDYAHPQVDTMARWMGPTPPSPAGEAPALPVSYVPALQYEILMPRYMNEPSFLASRLPHRCPEEVQRLEGHIGWLSWADLIDGVLDRSAGFTPEQHLVLRRLVDWLRDKRLLHKGS